MLDGLNYLSNSVLEVSDSITSNFYNECNKCIVSGDNIQKNDKSEQLNIINTLGNKKKVKSKKK